ncbi:telomerase-binding protein EST1A [Caerostris extrusa]|uniref:Telomerase-binding protein EST1A n=1 Tax=Caerostris extrusa TaxID=172846 RepID=A0AAV4V2P5_CAEEX|nr:telomerase-binding protein EST1A [Caerostris extrusa]
MVNIVHRTEGTCSENCHINKQTDVNYETMDVTKMDNSTHKGLMNKNLKSNDNCTKIRAKNSDSRKSSKTKRPTMPIYVPKCKMMAELNQTENGAPKQKIKEDKNIQKKMPNLSITKASKVEANKKPFQKKCEKELGNNLLSKDSNCSSLNNNSWADIMDNLSTDSRSSPENDLRKNHSDSETLVSQNKKLQNERTSNEHLSYGDHKNVKKNIQQRNMKVSNNNSNVQVKKQGLKQNETTSSKVITGDAVQKPYNNSTLEIPNNLNTNSDIKNINNKKQFQKYSRIYYSFDAKSKDKKPDKAKSNPPKLKKNKITKAEETENNIEYMPIPASSAQNTSRGILKVPALYENNETKSDRFEITSSSPKKISDSCTYIHKKLYDPNNPDKPEIVNIPAPILHEKFNRQDYSTGYIPFSQFANPIPPPHPVVNPLLAYGHGEYIPPPVPLPPEPSSECYTAENKRKSMLTVIFLSCQCS